MKKWKRIKPTTVRKVGHRVIVSKTFELPDGRKETFELFNEEGARDVATIAITTDGKALVFRQFRPGPEIIMDELPGGSADDQAESTEAAARRELEEETGYVPGKFQYLGKLNEDAYSNSWFYYFLATDCLPNGKGQQLEQNEQSGELLKISIEQLIENAKSGKMTDSGAILLAYDLLLKLKEKTNK